MSKKDEKIMHDLIKSVLDALDVSGNFTIATSSENEEVEDIDIALETPDTSLVIGYHGEGLEALQLLLSLAISKKLDRFVRVSLEIGDYKKNRSDYLKSLALRTKERVITEQREIALPELKSWERRLVHVFLQDDSDVVSESSGEGRDRVLVIKPKNA